MKAIFVPLFFPGLIICVLTLVAFKGGDSMAMQKNSAPTAGAVPQTDAGAPVRTETATFALG